jgi:pimeloyl-ACP methyl ester carboxylesterase
MRHMVQANDIKQHYVEAGDGGPPMILLHEFPETWYVWRKQIPVLAARYRMIVPDLRGYGETESAAGYDKRTMAADIRALRTTLGSRGHRSSATTAPHGWRRGSPRNIPRRSPIWACSTTFRRG